MTKPLFNPTLPKLAFASAISLALAAPALAADKAKVEQAKSAFSGCISNIANSRNAARAIEGTGLQDVGTAGEVISFGDADDAIFVGSSTRGATDKLCLMMVEDMSLREANALAAGYAKALKLPAQKNDDRELSKVWQGERSGRTLVLLVQKKKDAGIFQAPAIAVVLGAN